MADAQTTEEIIRELVTYRGTDADDCCVAAKVLEHFGGDREVFAQHCVFRGPAQLISIDLAQLPRPLLLELLNLHRGFRKRDLDPEFPVVYDDGAGR